MEVEFVELVGDSPAIGTDNLWMLPMKPENLLRRERGLEQMHGKDFFKANCFVKAKDKSGHVTGYSLTYSGYLDRCGPYFNLGLKVQAESINRQLDFVERELSK